MDVEGLSPNVAAIGAFVFIVVIFVKVAIIGRRSAAG